MARRKLCPTCVTTVHHQLPDEEEYDSVQSAVLALMARYIETAGLEGILSVGMQVGIRDNAG